MSEKNNIFAHNYEPTALATNSGGVIPTPTGEAAERFIRMAEENERKARENEKKPMTLEEAKRELTHNNF